MALLLTSGLFVSVPAMAKKELTFCVDNWEGLTNVDGTGSYSETVKAVYEDEYKITIKIFPWARAQKEFRNKKCDGLIAENKPEPIYAKPQIVLDALELQAYFLKGKTKFKGEKTLKTAQLAWLRGYNYHKLVDYPLNFTEFNSVHAGFKMLEAQRFEIMLDYTYTFKDECKTSGADCSKIDGAPSGIIERVYVIFQGTSKGKKLAQAWDDKMTLLLKSGKVQKIFEKYSQKYPINEVHLESKDQAAREEIKP